MKPGVTVVVCTHNGARLLPETIRHIAFQHVRPEIPWEIIVVDNASTDNTSEVVRSEWAKYGKLTPMTLLFQPKKGLVHARETGIKEAHYEYILFCDDDNWLSQGYVQLAYELMTDNLSIGVLGGHGELTFEEPPPLWASGLKAFASGPQAKKSGKVRHNAVYGAGCVARKAALNKLYKAGYKPMLTDRKGQSLSTGGDYELCYAIALAGFDIWYDDRLRFMHFMPAKRITWDYCTRFFKDGAQSFEVLIPYRVRVNMNARSITSFNLKLVRIMYYYLKKMPPLLLYMARLRHGSEKYLQYKVKLLSLKYKLASFRNYTLMKQHFYEVLRLEQNLKKGSSGTEIS